MKAVVMEKKNDKLIVLTQQGEFIEIIKRGNKLDIGDELNINNTLNKNNIVRRLASVAAVFIILLSAGFGVYGYYTPYGYVNVDINPSVEISYNLYNKVIRLRGLNNDGNNVIENINDFKNKSIDYVVNEVVDAAIENNYINEEKENAVLVTVIEESKKIDNESLQKSVKNHIKNKNTKAEVMVVKTDTKKSLVKNNDNENVTPGKSILINKALEINKNLNYEQVSKKPINEIMKIVKENKKNEIKTQDNKNKEKDSNEKDKNINKNNSNKDNLNDKKDNKDNKDNKEEKQDERNKKSKNQNDNKDDKNSNSNNSQKKNKNKK